MLKKLFHINIVRQLFGAVVGATLAYAAYSGYGIIENTARAYLLPPGGDRDAYTGEVRIATSEDDEQTERKEARAERIAAQLRENKKAVLGQQAVSSMSADSTAEEPVATISSASSDSSASSVSSLVPITPAISEDAPHGSAPTLPSSGIGLWIATLFSVSIASMSIRKCRRYAIRMFSRVITN